MKIIVLGAGKVGKTLIKHMSNEDHDIKYFSRING